MFLGQFLSNFDRFDLAVDPGSGEFAVKLTLDGGAILRNSKIVKNSKIVSNRFLWCPNGIWRHFEWILG